MRDAKPPARRCVFCDGTGTLTNEHVYPQWIWREFGATPKPPPAVIPYSVLGHNERFRLVDDQPPIRTFEVRSERPYMHATGRKVRVVCAGCNNGWMAQLEECVRDILVNISALSRWKFAADEVATLQRWVAKTGLMVENFDPDLRLAGPDLYRAVKAGEPLPGSWYFGLARVTPENDFEAIASPLVARVQTREAEPARFHEQAYVTSYMITVNRLLFLARYSPFPVEPPVRLDHDLHRHPMGTPLTLRPHRSGLRILRRSLPLMYPESMQDLMTWGHPVSSAKVSMTLLGDGERRWVGNLETATKRQLMAPWAHLPEFTPGDGVEDDGDASMELFSHPLT